MTAESDNAGRFHTTRWTLVLAARGGSAEAKQALCRLCETYYGPVESFVRRYRRADDVRDLTHEFFVRLLEGASLDGADRSRGRFRSYLLGAVKHFLADHEDRRRAAIRGGGREPQSLDQIAADVDDWRGNARVADQVSDPRGFPPDEFFDRHWAITVVESAIDALRSEAQGAGEAERFEILKPWLVAPTGRDTLIAAARSLDMTEGSFNVAVHRLRKRFRRAVKLRIADTVSDSAEIADELQYLIAALCAPIHHCAI